MAGWRSAPALAPSRADADSGAAAEELRAAGAAPPARPCRRSASRREAAEQASAACPSIFKRPAALRQARRRPPPSTPSSARWSTGSAPISPACRQLSATSSRSAPTAASPRASSTSRSPARSASTTTRRARSRSIADGSSVVVRDRKLATQDLYPLSQTPLRFLLADRIDLLRDTNVVGVYRRRRVRHRRDRGEADRSSAPAG